MLQIMHFLFSMPVLSTIPALLAWEADATAHAQAQRWKGSSSQKTALKWGATLQC